MALNTWIYEQVGPSTLDYEKATFVLYDTETGTNVTNLLPVPRGGVCVDAEIVPKDATTAAFTLDILVTRAGTAFATRSSIFGATKLVVPSGTAAGAVIAQTVFATDPFALAIDDVLSADILAGDGSGVFTAVLKWRV